MAGGTQLYRQAVIFLAGALTMGLAPNYAALMVGRFLARSVVGYGLMIAPVYAVKVSQMFVPRLSHLISRGIRQHWNSAWICIELRLCQAP